MSNYLFDQLIISFQFIVSSSSSIKLKIANYKFKSTVIQEKEEYGFATIILEGEPLGGKRQYENGLPFKQIHEVMHVILRS